MIPLRGNELFSFVVLFYRLTLPEYTQGMFIEDFGEVVTNNEI